MIRILYVDDSPLDRALVRDALEREAQGFQLTEVGSRGQFEALLETAEPFDLVLSDFNIMGMTGLDVLERIHELYPRVPVILVTGTGSEEVAVRAMKAGASDYVIKQPSHIRRLPQTILTTLEAHALRMERDDAIRELRASEARFRFLAEHSSDLLARLDPAGRILYASPAALPLLGVEADVLHGMPLHLRVVEEDREALDQVLRGIRNTPRTEGDPRQASEASRPVSFRLLPVAGHLPVRWVEATGRYIEGTDTPTGAPELHLSLRDVSERKAMEAELARSAERLQEAQRLEAIGRLAGGVAHDFNNLLTVIRSNAELIEAELPPGDPLRTDAQEIARAALRAGELTRHLVLFSSGGMGPLEALELEPFLDETVALVRRALPDTIPLQVAIEPCLPVLRTQSTLLQQVILNLALNARDAVLARADGGEQGQIWLSVDCTLADGLHELWAGEPPPHPSTTLLRIQVRDNGCGMSREVRARIFEPFFTTKAMGQGTGLGLATAFGTVRQAGGTIQVESAPGEGSTFALLLPLAPEDLPGGVAEHAAGDVPVRS